MINELNNTANVSGTIDGQTTTLTSNTLEVNVINGLTAVKSADKIYNKLIKKYPPEKAEILTKQKLYTKGF